jgi:hypothetical protein
LIRNVETQMSAPTISCPRNISQANSNGAKAVKYILMMHGKRGDWDAYVNWPREDLRANMAFMQVFAQELEESGALVATHGLTSPGQAKVVRADRNGEPVTDGIIPEAKEFLAAFWIIDVETQEQAYKVAARASAAPGPGGTTGSVPVEVREIMATAPKEWL